MTTLEMILAGAGAVGWLVALGLGVKVKKTTPRGDRFR